jgi:hypothetical protein
VRAQEGKAQQGNVYVFEVHFNSLFILYTQFHSDWCTDWKAERKKPRNHEFL